MIYTYGYLFYVPITLVFMLLILFQGIKNKRTYQYYCFAVIFAIYLNCAVEKVYFPLIIDDISIWGSIENYIELSFKFQNMGGLYQIIGNIVLTIPLGMLLPFITNLRNKGRFILIVVISFMIEIVQLWIIYFFHSLTIIFDIKDIILNVSGGIFGFIICLLIAKIALKIPANDKRNPIIHFVHNVLINIAEGKRSLDRR